MGRVAKIRALPAAPPNVRWLVALLDGWIGSEGALTEYEVARACGIKILDVRSWVEFAKAVR